MHVIAAKAVCFKEALTPEFKKYQEQILKNCRTLSAEIAGLGYRIVAGGTDTHLFLVDLTNKKITGKEAATVLDRTGITVNKNLIPFDLKPAAVTSGIRLGTPAVTTRGMKEEQMKIIASLITKVAENIDNEEAIAQVGRESLLLCSQFPVPEHFIIPEKKFSLI